MKWFEKKKVPGDKTLPWMEVLHTGFFAEKEPGLDVSRELDDWLSGAGQANSLLLLLLPLNHCSFKTSSRLHPLTSLFPALLRNNPRALQ